MSPVPCMHSTETRTRNCSSDKCWLFIFLQLERLENKIDNNECQEKNNALYQDVWLDWRLRIVNSSVMALDMVEIKTHYSEVCTDWWAKVPTRIRTGNFWINKFDWLKSINTDSSPLDFFPSGLVSFCANFGRFKFSSSPLEGKMSASTN